MKKPTTPQLFLWLAILFGAFQLTREVFGLGTWQSRGYIERYKGMENLLPFLLESPGIWIIICSFSYYRLHKKGGQLLWGPIAIQGFFLLAMYHVPMAKFWFFIVWPLFAFIMYYGNQYAKAKTKRTNSDILDDPDF
ncbi:hypothetical protein [Lewinella cohaerens]|uniref:hypothetical protein n=1 Tax=Lewinella cohaerens TaxID=70995 RepID=UPI00037A1A75|nr:hypothetical protein [Lewinella cohaerens]